MYYQVYLQNNHHYALPSYHKYNENTCKNFKSFLTRMHQRQFLNEIIFCFLQFVCDTCLKRFGTVI